MPPPETIFFPFYVIDTYSINLDNLYIKVKFILKIFQFITRYYFINIILVEIYVIFIMALAILLLLLYTLKQQTMFNILRDIL